MATKHISNTIQRVIRASPVSIFPETQYAQSSTLHIFTHGASSIFNKKRSSIGCIITMTTPSIKEYCVPIIAICKPINDYNCDGDAIAYKSIIEGLSLISKLKYINVDIINDNKDVITALKLGSKYMTRSNNFALFDECDRLSKIFLTREWINTRTKYNKSAIEIANYAFKYNKTMCKYLPNDDPAITSILQFIHSDFLQTYNLI